MKVEEEKGESGEELVMKRHSSDKVEKRKSAFFYSIPYFAGDTL